MMTCRLRCRVGAEWGEECADCVTVQRLSLQWSVSDWSGPYLVSIELMKFGTAAMIGQTGLFAMIQVSLLFLMTMLGHRRPLDPLFPLLSREFCLDMWVIVEGLIWIQLFLQTNKFGYWLPARLILELPAHLVVSRIIEWRALRIMGEIELLRNSRHVSIKVFVQSSYIRESLSVKRPWILPQYLIFISS